MKRGFVPNLTERRPNRLFSRKAAEVGRTGDSEGLCGERSRDGIVHRASASRFFMTLRKAHDQPREAPAGLAVGSSRGSVELGVLSGFA